ncbi:MAG TPA: MerR family transcriptional regulator [Polyangiaceae bacterium]|nr:MerR family transcriptional regulator [Polyangiaceae bacterium]
MARPLDQPIHRLPIADVSAGNIAMVPGRRDSSRDVADEDEGLLQVGDLARVSGKTVRAIHLYEELGLLKPHARSKGRYRLFSQDAVVRVRWIGKLQDLGLSLTTIQSVVREWEMSPSAPGAMAKMRNVYREKLASTREQIERLKALETELADSLKYLETCDTCDPVRLFAACTCCDRHDHREDPPELVLGFRASSATSGT